QDAMLLYRIRTNSVFRWVHSMAGLSSTSDLYGLRLPWTTVISGTKSNLNFLPKKRFSRTMPGVLHSLWELYSREEDRFHCPSHPICKSCGRSMTLVRCGAH